MARCRSSRSWSLFMPCLLRSLKYRHMLNEASYSASIVVWRLNARLFIHLTNVSQPTPFQLFSRPRHAAPKSWAHSWPFEAGGCSYTHIYIVIIFLINLQTTNKPLKHTDPVFLTWRYSLTKRVIGSLIMLIWNTLSFRSWRLSGTMLVLFSLLALSIIFDWMHSLKSTRYGCLEIKKIISSLITIEIWFSTRLTSPHCQPKLFSCHEKSHVMFELFLLHEYSVMYTVLFVIFVFNTLIFLHALWYVLSRL